MKAPRIPRREGIMIGSLAALSIVVLGFRKIIEYAASPTQPKNCTFFYPASGSAAAITFDVPGIPLAQKGGFLNDASCLNKTPIYGIVNVEKTEDIRNAILFARKNALKISIAGKQHSMGGQSMTNNGLVLNMKGFNAISADLPNKRLHAQAGATWEDIQKILDAKGLAVKAMQSINIFTLGGSLSVNAHGIAHHPGPIAATVRSIHIMLPDGQVKFASREENRELFRHALGGYGLFGDILDADIELTDNMMYQQEDSYMDYAVFPAYYEKEIEKNNRYGLFYARLSVAPQSYLRETAVHALSRVDHFSDAPPPL